MIAEEFEQIAIKYEPLIKKLIAKYQLTWDYQEMYQIGLIALWKAWNNFQPEKGVFPAYAKSYVRGRLLTEIKKRKHYYDHHLFTEELPEKPIVESDSSLFISEWLTKNVLSQREKLWLKEAVLLGKETKRIADEQGVSVDTVRSWKKTALRKLRKVLKNQISYP